MPPPLTHGPEPLEGGSLLEEVPGPLGVLLWQALRDVVLWSSAPPERRSELFADAAGARRREHLERAALPPELEAPLATLAGPLREPGPERELVQACRQVTGWAQAQGLLAVALGFAQAAALLRGDSAADALAVGVLARRRAEHARAESWLRRAVMLARQSGDWSSYCLAFSGLGILYQQRGNLPVARKLHLRARRAARRHGLRSLEGHALHDLFVIATSSGSPAEAEAFAAAALAAYGSRHARVPALAHDVAYFWLERGHFARALPVFQAVLPHLSQPADRVRALADVARAAAGLGREPVFAQAWEEALALVDRPEAAEGAAQALLDLAHGAAMLRRWVPAQRAAARALEIARERNEGRVLLEAESVLDSVQRRSALESAPAAAPPAPAAGEEADALASTLVRHLSAPTAGAG